MFRRLVLVGFLTVGLVSVAPAQRGPQGGGGFGGDEGGGGGFGGAPGGFGGPGGGRYQENRLEKITDMLKLSKEQKSGTKEIFDAAQKEAAPVREGLQKARATLATAYLEKQSQAQIDQLVTSYANLEVQMANIELKAFAKLAETLKPDQQKRVGQVFLQMAGMFAGRDWNRIGN